jgi:hypothetical protein
MSAETNKDELVNMITYIKQKVGDLNVNERKDILQMLINSGIEDSRIHSKGRGTQIKFMDIPTDMIVSIYKFIQVKINEKMENLKNFTEENEEQGINSLL